MSKFWNTNPNAPFWKSDPASLFWVTLASTFLYDAVSRLVEAGYPDSQPVSYIYDKMGNRKFSGLPTYVYDDVGRLTQLNCPDGSSVVYSYDFMGNRTSVVMTSVD